MENQRHNLEKKKAITWAKTILAGNPVILDFETTGIGDAEIVQIGAVDKSGSVVMDLLIKPTQRIPQEVIRVHGITNERVKDAPGFPSIYVQLSVLLAGQTLVAYNADFEKGILQAVCRRHKLSLPRLAKWECAMKTYAGFWGAYSPKFGGFSYQKLTNACAQQQITVADAHSGAGDALMTLKLIETMARDE